MNPSDDKKERFWLRDINEAIEKIESHPRFAEGKDAFLSDEYFRVWVLYHVERIGECASNLRRDFDYDNKHPDVDWQGAQGMRRHIVHRYWDTDPQKVWQGVEYLPTIKMKVAELLKSKNDPLV